MNQYTKYSEKNLMDIVEQFTYAKKVISIVCFVLQTDYESLKIKGRKQENVFSRYFVYNIMRDKKMIYKNIAILFNRDDPRAVLFGLRAFDKALLSNYKDYRVKFEKVNEILRTDGLGIIDQAGVVIHVDLRVNLQTAA
jgi:hypothetical protein